MSIYRSISEYMVWEEVDDIILSDHRDIDSFDGDSINIVHFDGEPVHLFVGYVKGSEGDDRKYQEQSFVFMKADGWTLDKAKQWFNENRGRESFNWVGEVEVVPGKNLIRGTAIHPVKTYHPKEWPKVRQYLESELKASAKSLIGTPLMIDHWRILPYEVVGAAYEDGAVEYVAECDDQDILDKIRHGQIKHTSPEFKWKILERQDDGAIAPKNIEFSALSLLEFLPPGDPKTTVEVWEGVLDGIKKHSVKTKAELGTYLAGGNRPANIISAPGENPAQLSLEELLEWSLLKERTLIFHGDVNEHSSKKALRRLEFLAKESNEPIHVILNSVGGSVYNGMLVYDTMAKLAKAGIEIICEARGLAASMGSILLQAGTTRIATPNTRFLIHEVSDFMWGKTSEIKDQVEELAKVNKMMVDILAERTGRSADEIHKVWHKKDVWMSAEEAQRFGLIDQISEGNPKLALTVREYAFLKEAATKKPGQPTEFLLTPEEVSEILGEPFAGFKNWDACIAANSHKEKPIEYCAAIKHKVGEATLAEAENRMFQQIAELRQRLNESNKSEGLYKSEAVSAKIELQQLIGDVEAALPQPSIMRYAGATGIRTVQSVKAALLKYKERSE